MSLNVLQVYIVVGSLHLEPSAAAAWHNYGSTLLHYLNTKKLYHLCV